MTLRTSPTMVGSRALVGSSNKMTSGSIARVRAMATRCFCPPESSLGMLFFFSAKPTARRSFMARSRASSRESPRAFTGAYMMFSMTLMWL